MSQAGRYSKFRSAARNPSNQFLVDALVKCKAIADARRLDNQSNCYNRILRSLSKYPLPLVCQEQCLMLEGVGSKMGRMLKGLIQNHYRAYMLNPPPQLSSQFIEDNVEQFDGDEDVDSVKSCDSMFLRKKEEEIGEQLDEAHSLSVMKCHSSMQNHFSKRAPDTQSVSSNNSVTSKYPLREGSSALFLLRVLFAQPGQSQSRNDIKLSVDQRFKHPIKVWTFLKKLESTEMITIEKGEGGQRYKLTSLGEQTMAEYEQKQKPCSSTYNELLKQIEVTQISSSANKSIEKQYLRQSDLEPYEVALLIDCRQIKDKQSREYFYDKLGGKYGVNCRTCNLSVGDFLWVIDSKPRGTLVLDYIIERKLADDLAASISDGRYKQQKYRLKNCGISNCYYIYEGHPTTYSVLNERALQTAVRRTQLKQRFHLLRTENTLNTLEYISALHRSISKTISNQELVTVCGNLQQFTEVNAKSYLTMNNLLGLMLKSLPNVGRNTAIALVSKFGTFRELYDCLLKLPAEQRAKFIGAVIRRNNRSNHEAIAKLLVQVCFGKAV